MKRGTLVYLVYLFIGFIGVPVFSGFTGGPAKLLGPTGGYLIGFVFMSVHLYLLASEGISQEKTYATAALLIIIVFIINTIANAIGRRTVNG